MSGNPSGCDLGSRQSVDLQPSAFFPVLEFDSVTLEHRRRQGAQLCTVWGNDDPQSHGHTAALMLFPYPLAPNQWPSIFSQLDRPRTGGLQRNVPTHLRTCFVFGCARQAWMFPKQRIWWTRRQPNGLHPLRTLRLRVIDVRCVLHLHDSNHRQ